MSNSITPIIVWLRRDLRILDNPALYWASKQQKPLLIVYIAEKTDEDIWALGAASRWWLHHSLQSLSADLGKSGGRLHILAGGARQAIEQVLDESGADTVVWNRRYEPASIQTDSALKTHLSAKNINVQSFAGNLCHEPWQVQRQGQYPYRVFTAWWRASLKQESMSVTPAVSKFDCYRGALSKEVSLDSLCLLPTINWARSFPTHWSPGEASANVLLQNLIENKLKHYQSNRDVPSCDGTSRLSPHLAFGEISPRQINAEIRRALVNKKIPPDDDTETFLKEIGWREFAVHLIYHFPHTTDEPMDKRFDNFKWNKVIDEDLARWQQGNTGIPLVDAGMRQLWQTGWMHNRVRMVAGSFLIKNMGYHWLVGASWFWDTLLDADLASNTMGWQWVAGSGADAAPYFRIFNPVRQSERFDADGDYVRKWVPEIAGLSNKSIHAPWTASPAELLDNNIVPGETYPQPIVDLSKSRIEALNRFDKIKTNK